MKRDIVKHSKYFVLNSHVVCNYCYGIKVPSESTHKHSTSGHNTFEGTWEVSGVWILT